MPAQTKIQYRRDTSANWSSTNPVLAEGEIGIATDTQGFKIGDGSTAWNLLPYHSQAVDVGQTNLLIPDGAYLSGSGLVLSGLASNYGSTPDSIPVSITGDIEIIVRIKLNDWTPSITQVYIGKYGAAGQRSYRIYVSSASGALIFSWSADGTTEQTLGVSQPSFVDGTTYWIRMTMDVDNGAGGKTVTFYYAQDSVSVPTSWTQIGTPQTTAGTTSIFDSTSVLEFGSSQNGYNNINGILYRAIVKKGIDGIIVVDSDFSTQTANAVAFNATSDTGIKSGGLTLRAISGQYASTPDSTALSITGDIDIIAKVTMPDWTPTTSQAIVSKTGASSSYMMYINLNDGFLVLRTSPDGSTNLFHTSSTPLPVIDGGTLWMRATLDVDNGAGSRVAKFYTSTNGISWTQLGSTMTYSGTTSIVDTTAALEIGSGASGTGTLFNGTIHRVTIRNGFDGAGTIVFDEDFSEETTGSTSFTSFSSVGIGQDGLVLNGTTLQYASTPDSAALTMTDIEVISRLNLTTYTTNQFLCGVWADGGNNRSWYVGFNGGTGTMRIQQDALGDFTNIRTHNSTVAPPVSGNTTYWFRWILDTDNGASGTTARFYYAADTGSASILPSSWTQVGTDVVTAGTLGIYNSSQDFGLGIQGGANNLPTGTISRLIVYNAIGSSAAFDANFEAVKIGASSFTESSANAATVTIKGITNPTITVNGSTDPLVTINTTRYFLGIPNLYPQTVSTFGTGGNFLYYQYFVTENPISIDMIAFEVTTGPASAANVTVGLYKADKYGQPNGPPILDSGSIPVAASATGMFRKQFTPTIIQSGMYILVINTSVGMTLRLIRGGPAVAANTLGTSPYRGAYYNGVTQGPLPSTLPGWIVFGTTASSQYYLCFMRYTSI